MVATFVRGRDVEISYTPLTTLIASGGSSRRSERRQIRKGGRPINLATSSTTGGMGGRNVGILYKLEPEAVSLDRNPFENTAFLRRLHLALTLLVNRVGEFGVQRNEAEGS